MRPTMIVALVFLAAACSRGPSIRKLPHTTNPIGAQATVVVGSRQFAGELIAVQDSGYLVRNATDRFVFVPFSAGPRVRTSVRRAVSGRPIGEDLRVLRLSSRYPYGISPTVLRALLAQRAQAEVELVQ